MWVFDANNCLLEAAPPVDPFDGGEVSTRDGLGSSPYSVASFVPGSSSFHSVQVAMQPVSILLVRPPSVVADHGCLQGAIPYMEEACS